MGWDVIGVELDQRVRSIDRAIRSGQPSAVAGSFVSLCNEHPDRAEQLLQDLDRDGLVEHARLLRLVGEQPPLLGLDERSAWWSAAFVILVLVAAASVGVIATWPSSVPALVAMTLAVGLLVSTRLAIRPMFTSRPSTAWHVWRTAMVIAVAGVLVAAGIGASQPGAGVVTVVYAGLLGQMSWRTARLVTIRGLERRTMAAAGLDASDRRLARALFDDALYHQTTAGGSSVLVAVIGSMLMWALVAGVVVAIAAGAGLELVSGYLLLFFIVIATAVTLTTLDYWRMWRRPQLAAPEHAPARTALSAAADLEQAVDLATPSGKQAAELVTLVVQGRWSKVVLASRRPGAETDAAVEAASVRLGQIGAPISAALIRVANSGPDVITPARIAAAGPVVITMLPLLVAYLYLRAAGALSGPGILALATLIGALGIAAIIRVGAATLLRRRCETAAMSDDRDLVGALFVLVAQGDAATTSTAGLVLAIARPLPLFLAAGMVAVGVAERHMAEAGILAGALLVALAGVGVDIAMLLSDRARLIHLGFGPVPSLAVTTATGPSGAVAPVALPVVVRHPRPVPYLVVGFCLVFILAIGIVSHQPIVIAGALAVTGVLGFVVWARFRRSAVVITDSGITESWLFGVRHFAWDDVVELRPTSTPNLAGPELRLVDSSREQFDLIAGGRLTHAESDALVGIVARHARGVPDRRAAARRGARFVLLPVLWCLATGLAIITVAVPFSDATQPVDPADAPPGYELYIAKGSRQPYIQCASTFAWLSGERDAVCAGAVQGQAIAMAIVLGIDALVAFGIVRLSRSGRHRRHKRQVPI